MAAITNLLPLGGWLAAFERWARPKLNYALTRWVFLPKLKSESPQIRSYAAEALAEFGSAIDAVQCAVDIQQALSRRNADVPEDRRIILRIGISLGDVIVDGDDLFGNGVNVAARMEGLAEPGTI